MKITLILIIILIFHQGCIKRYIPELTKDSVEGKLESTIPFGWVLTGSAVDEYHAYLDSEIVSTGSYSASLLSFSAQPEHYATLRQAIKAGDYRGKRVRFKANLRANRVRGWTGLGMRADSEDKRSIAFDNMYDRRIEGSVEWNEYQIVLDIPSHAEEILFGVLLNGTGQVWIDGCTLEIVDDEVEPTSYRALNVKKMPSTPEYYPEAPVNLDFEILTDF